MKLRFYDCDAYTQSSSLHLHATMRHINLWLRLGIYFVLSQELSSIQLTHCTYKLKI
jgi:hypothetical protein